MTKTLDVAKVGFFKKTLDDRPPESFPFPACMASLFDYLGEGFGTEVIDSGKTSFTKRLSNDAFIASSGMGFGVLWDDNRCPSSYDLTQVDDHNAVIRRAFAWGGRDCEIIDRYDGGTAEKAYNRIVESIDSSVPALIFGLFDIPECAIIAGYDDGNTLIGYSHFQPEKERGMFRANDWDNVWWKAIIPLEKTGTKSGIKDVLRAGFSIMTTSESEGYTSGISVYDKWINAIENMKDMPEEGIEKEYKYMHDLAFSLAEARCWTASFLRRNGYTEIGDCLDKVHKLVWKIDGKIVRWENMMKEEKRNTYIDILREIKETEKLSIEKLSVAVQ